MATKQKPVNLKNEDRKKLLTQCKDEYEHALKYRQKREQDWREVDDLYYGKKKKSLITRANIHLPKMQGTIDAFIAKIDDAPYIDLQGREEGDEPSAHRANGLLKSDMQSGDWELIDLLSKKEAALYGRTIIKKWATNNKDFEDHIELIDVLDFVIDPLAGGAFPFRYANYCGQDNIIRSVHDLSDKTLYDQKVVEEITQQLKSDTDKDNKFRSLFNRRDSLGMSDAVHITEESVRLIEWYTTWNGKRWYVLFSPEHMKIVRADELENIAGHDEFPFSSWALFPRAHEFWTPGLGENIKEVNIVQNILLSQILDNNAYRNYGMKAYDSSKVINPAELVPVPMGRVAVNGNPNDAIKDITFPAIEQALTTFKLVDQMFAQETGVTPNAKGMPHSKRMSATEFAGLLDEVADRFFTANRTYKHHLRRIVKLYLLGLNNNMTKERAVRVLGAKGYEWRQAKIDDVKKEFDIIISSGAEEESAKNIARDRFRDYRAANADNQRLNQKFLDEKEARLMGMNDGEIQRLMNPDIEGDWEILAEAASENQEMLRKDMEPNRGATVGHIQKHLDFAQSTQSLDEKQRARILRHANAEMAYAAKNEEMRVRKIIDEKKQQSQNIGQQPVGTAPAVPQQPAQPNPAAPPIPQPVGAAPAVPQPPQPIPGNPASVVPEDVRAAAIAGAPPNINP